MAVAADHPDHPDHNPTTGETVRKILIASSGNLVEWFDFYLYAFFSVYFAQQFFGGDQTQAFLGAAGVILLSFLMRPLGGYVFGRLADRYGRKTSMVTSVTLMSIGSLLMAVLPTSAQVGAAAPVLMLLVRCLQAFSVGGEYGATATYMSEVAQRGRRGFYSSFQYVTLIGGQLLASLLATVMQLFMTSEQLTAGGWRYAFVIGAALGLISLWLRRSLTETQPDAAKTAEHAGTLRGVLRHKRSVLVVLGITCFGSLVFYSFTTYMQKYLINTAGMTKATASNIMTVCLLIFMCAQPVVGALSDRIGRKASMFIFSIGMMLVIVPAYRFLGANQSPQMATLCLTGVMMILSFYTSIAGVLKAEMFPTEVRALATGFIYAIGNALFGGSAEFVALSLKDRGHEGWFPVYVTGMAVVCLIAVVFMRDNRRHGFFRHD